MGMILTREKSTNLGYNGLTGGLTTNFMLFKTLSNKNMARVENLKFARDLETSMLAQALYNGVKELISKKSSTPADADLLKVFTTNKKDQDVSLGRPRDYQQVFGVLVDDGAAVIYCMLVKEKQGEYTITVGADATLKGMRVYKNDQGLLARHSEFVFINIDANQPGKEIVAEITRYGRNHFRHDEAHSSKGNPTVPVALVEKAIRDFEFTKFDENVPHE